MKNRKNNYTNLTFKKVNQSQKTILQNLLQLYLYDFSAFSDISINNNGIFEYKYFDCYFTENQRHPFLLYEKETPIGFCMIRELSNKTFSIAEFFILKTHRKNGFGYFFISRMFEIFKGKWEINVLKNNINACFFWNNIIKKHTNNNFSVTTENNSLTYLFKNN